MNLLNLFTALLALFGGIALSLNSDNRGVVVHVIAVFGNIALLLCAAITLTALSYQLCSQSGNLCVVNSFFTDTLLLPVSDEQFRFRAFLATGWFGSISIYLVLALAFAKQRTFKVLAFIGATALLLSGVVALWQIVAEPIIHPGLAR